MVFVSTTSIVDPESLQPEVACYYKEETLVGDIKCDWQNGAFLGQYFQFAILLLIVYLVFFWIVDFLFIRRVDFKRLRKVKGTISYLKVGIRIIVFVFLFSIYTALLSNYLGIVIF